MKFLLGVAAAAVVLCGCASNDQGGMNSSSGREQGEMSDAQRENLMRNRVSDNLQNPGVNWKTW